MSVLYLMIPLALVLAAAALAGFIWSVRRGQLDDLDTPPTRILFDDEDLPPKS
jgi:cbb3-type cytochrome oxidase maturation protein